MVQKDIKLYLKEINENKLDSLNLKEFTNVFHSDTSKHGDHLLYALHMCCKKRLDTQGMDPKIVKLCQLCFLDESVGGFCNMERYLGCMYHINSYLIKHSAFELVMYISKSLECKVNDIENESLESQKIRNILFALHTQVITSAKDIALQVKDVNEKKAISFSYALARLSVKFLNMIILKQLEFGRKAFKNYADYFNSLKFHSRTSIREIYVNLEEAMFKIMPNYQENDFLLYYIIKMDAVAETTNLEEMNEYFWKRVRIALFLLNDSKTEKYWKWILSAGLSYEKFFPCLLGAFNKVLMGDVPRLHALMFGIIFYRLLHVWMTSCTEDWCAVFTTKTVEMIYTGIICPLATGLGKLTDHCRMKEYQINICFADILTRNHLEMLELIRSCLKHNTPNCMDLMVIGRELFDNVARSLRDLTKECCASRKRRNWNSLVIHYANIVERLLGHHKTENALTHLRDCSRELIVEVINAEFEIPYEWNRVKVLFERWHFASIKLNEFDEAMFASAFYAVLFPDKVEDMLPMWVQAKGKMTSDDSESPTIKDFIVKHANKMTDMKPKCQPLAQNFKRLLMMDMTACRFSSHFSPKACMNAVMPLWDSLNGMTLLPWERAGALSHVICAAVAASNSEVIDRYRTECKELIAAVLEPQKKRSVRDYLYAGNLKYSLFLCRVKSVQDEEEAVSSTREVLEYLRREQEENVKFGGEVDANLTCNIVPSSKQFTVSFEEEFLSELSEAMELWKRAAAAFVDGSLETHELSTWLEDIKHISQMYYLLGDVRQSFLSWLLCYRVARIADDRPTLVFALSQLIPAYKDIVGSDVIVEADVFAEELSTREPNAAVSFWLSLAANHMRNNDRNKCREYLRKVRDVLNSSNGNLQQYVHDARYWCLVSKYLCRYDGESMTEFGLNPGTELGVVVCKAFKYANTPVRKGAMGTFGSFQHNTILITMLEVDLWATHFFGAYGQISFMRYFLSDLYQIFQQLYFPTRTASLLLHLAEIDLVTEKLSDCQTKLASVKGILVSSTPSSSSKGNGPGKKNKGRLDLPPAAATDETEMGEPLFRPLSPARFLNIREPRDTETSTSPFRAALLDTGLRKRNHAITCECYSCSNIYIKLLNFECVRLEAHFCHMNGGVRDKSASLYNEGRKMISWLLDYQADMSESLEELLREDDSMVRLDFFGDEVRLAAANMIIGCARFALVDGSDADDILDGIDRLTYGVEEALMASRVLELRLVARVRARSRKGAVVVPASDDDSSDDYISSPVTVVAKTPAPPARRDRRDGAPMKPQRGKKGDASPGEFGVKPVGRRIFVSDDDDEDGNGKESKEKTNSNGRGGDTSRKRRGPQTRRNANG